MKKRYPVCCALMFLILVSGCKKAYKPFTDSDTGLDITSTFNIPGSGVILNPSGNAPLSALLVFISSTSGSTKIIVKGKNGPASDITQTFTDNGTSHAIPVLGLYPNYKNTVEITYWAATIQLQKAPSA